MKNIKFRLSLILIGSFLCLQSSIANAASDGAAQLPLVVPSSAYPDNCLYAGATEVSPDKCGFAIVHIKDSGNPVTNGTNLKNAINTPQCGPNGLIIALAPNVEYDGWWHLSYPGCNGKWIIIRSDISDYSLPRSGARVNPTYYGSAMPRLVGNTGAPPITTDVNFVAGHGANHYWMGPGLNVTDNNVNPGGPEAEIQIGDFGETAPNQLPSDITIDRSWVHGAGPLLDCNRGIMGNAINIVIMNNYISDIHSEGIESQGLSFFTTPGPGLVENNYIEGADEGIFFGGGDPSTKAITSDFTIINNHLNKPLAYWPGSPDYNGYSPFAKNHLELKEGQRILIEGNIFEHNWCCNSQQGEVLEVTPKDQYGTFTQSTVQDLTFRYNLARHAQTAFGIASVGTSNFANGFPASGLRRISLHDNLFYDIGGDWSETGKGTYADGNQYAMINMASSQDPLNGLSDSVSVDHNTIYGNNIYTSFNGDSMANYPFTHFNFTNNIFYYGSNPGHGMDASATVEGCPTLELTSTEVGAWDGNVLVGTPVANQKYYTSGCALPGPRAPLLSTSTTGGLIPDNTTIYIRATYTLGSGETTASPENPKLANWAPNFEYPRYACIQDSNFHEECSFNINPGVSSSVMPKWPLTTDAMTEDNGGYKGAGVTWVLHEPNGVLGTITTGKTGSNKNWVKVTLPIQDRGPETGWKIYASTSPGSERLQNAVPLSLTSSFILVSLPKTTGVAVPVTNTLPLAPPKWAGWPATWQDVGFENVNENNFSLSSSSPLKGKGTSGSDPGANYDLVIQKTTPALP